MSVNTFMRRLAAWQCTVTLTTAVPTMRAVSRVVKPGLTLNGVPHAGAASLGSAYWLVLAASPTTCGASTAHLYVWHTCVAWGV